MSARKAIARQGCAAVEDQSGSDLHEQRMDAFLGPIPIRGRVNTVHARRGRPDWLLDQSVHCNFERVRPTATRPSAFSENQRATTRRRGFHHLPTPAAILRSVHTPSGVLFCISFPENGETPVLGLVRPTMWYTPPPVDLHLP